ncbi:recombinase family protein [Acholeplasma sp. OttesenSCG-928-E16]|nr:recombinase family protein [Acholeplasma sp. OttesenSCG-928-E16]
MEQMIVTKISPLPKLDRKVRVAAYARVSTGKDAMLHSLSNQISYYNEKISRRDDCLFVEVYSDEAITGTKDNRAGFNKMIEDCRKGKIDLILTKSISRFARNTMTLLETVRELKTLNIDVYFEEQNIHSISNEGEMVLTFLASFAQEEARSFSENMKWRIKRDFEEGIIWGGQTDYCFGYRVVDKKLVVVPEEAELVRRIFSLYLEGYGFEMISKILTKEKLPTQKGRELWSKSTVRGIIGNYNYTGDLLLQKTYRENFLTKKKKGNNGEKDKFLIENNHEAIISKEVFNKATEIRMLATKKFKIKDISHIHYPLSSKIRCGKCGKNYLHRKTMYREFWSCSVYQSKGKAYCSSRAVPVDKLNNALCETFNISEITSEWVKRNIDFVEVFDENRLVVHMTDGTEKECYWKDNPVRSKWTPEMREQARLRALKQHKKDGE